MAADKTEHARVAEKLASRLDMIESRLARFDQPVRPDAPVRSAAASNLKQRLDAQRADADALRTRLSAAEAGIHRMGGRGERMRGELEGWINNEIRKQVAAAEGLLTAVVEEAQKDTLDAFVESVQKRVIVRISRLEHEISRQSNVMSELKESAEHTERSMERLLAGLDRLMVARDANDRKPHPVPSPVPSSSIQVVQPATSLPADLVQDPTPVRLQTPVEPQASTGAVAAQLLDPQPLPEPSAPLAATKQKGRKWSFFG